MRLFPLILIISIFLGGCKAGIKEYPTEQSIVSHLELVGHIKTHGKIFAYKNYIFVASQDNIEIFDTLYPTQPVKVGTYNTPNGSYSRVVVAMDHYMYILNRSCSCLNRDDCSEEESFKKYFFGEYPVYTCLHKVEISEPSAPIEISYLKLGQSNGQYHDFILRDGIYLYLTLHTCPRGICDHGVAVINIEPQIMHLTHFPINDPYFAGFVKAGDYIYLQFGEGIMDISKGLKKISDSHNIPGWIVAGKNDYIYTRLQNELLIIDISNPIVPVKVGSYIVSLDSDYDFDVVVVDDRAYIAPQNDGDLQVVDISEPMKPTLIGFYPANISDMVVTGDYVYLVDKEQGILILNADID